jgi:hypothetical protein
LEFKSEPFVGKSELTRTKKNTTDAVRWNRKMKNRMINLTKATLLSATLVAAAMTSPIPASAGNPNPGIFPVNAAPGGKSYGQWTAAWWQWAVSAPAGQNPWFDDTTGQFAAVGQSGQVWFLGASLGGSVERSFTIPQGKMLFLPVTPWIFGSVAGDCGASNPSVTCDVPTLRDSAAVAATSVQTMEVSIDEVPVQDIRRYRAISPDSFSVTLPQGDVFGLPAGTYTPQVADGYWLMLAPLAAGTHTITVHVIPNPSFGGEFRVIYHLTVGTP